MVKVTEATLKPAAIKMATITSPRSRAMSSFVARLSFICCAAALLSSCASVPDLPKEVTIPVAVPCVPVDTPLAPETLSIAQLAAMSDYELVLRIAADRLDLIAWVRQIEPVLQACRE